MSNINTQIDPTQPVKKIDTPEPLKKASEFLTPEQQSLGQLAFQTQVEPLRESFGKRLDQTTESLSKRGAFFGGTGQEQFREKLLKPQLQAESQIAGNIATTLGQTAMDQAYQTSEAAKNRQLQQSLQEAGFEFQSGQSDIGREFQAEQSQLGREFVSDESGLQRDFASEEARLGRELTQTESQYVRDFQEGENKIQRAFASEESRLGRELTQTESQYVRDFQEDQNRLQREAAQGSQEAAFEQQDRMARLEKDFQGDQLKAQQAFASEQNLLNRVLTQEESALTREYQSSYQEAGFDFAKDENALSRQEVRNNQALELALSGQITGDNVDDIMNEMFGEGVTLTTDDERDLQSLAAASGLSVDDYTRMRKAIGDGQLGYMMGRSLVNESGQSVDVKKLISDIGKPLEESAASTQESERELTRLERAEQSRIKPKIKPDTKQTKEDEFINPGLLSFGDIPGEKSKSEGSLGTGVDLWKDMVNLPNGLSRKGSEIFLSPDALNKHGMISDEAKQGLIGLGFEEQEIQGMVDSILQDQFGINIKQNIDDFIESPQAIRDFQLNIAQMETIAQKEIIAAQSEARLKEIQEQGKYS